MPNMTFLAENNIIAKSRHYICNWCNVKLSNDKSISKHVLRKKHQLSKTNAKIQKMVSENFIVLDSVGPTKYSCSLCNMSIDVLLDHIESPSHVDLRNKMIAENFIVRNASQKSQRNYHCLFCDSYFDELFDHIKDEHHQLNKEAPDKKSLLAKNRISSNLDFYMCEWCNDVELFAYKMVKKHVKEEKHLFNMGDDPLMLEVLLKNFQVTRCSETRKFDCPYCETSLEIQVHEVQAFDMISDHINNPFHISQKHKLLADNFIVSDVSENYYCFFCDSHFGDVIKHLNGPVHQSQKSLSHKRSLLSQNNIISKPAFYYCSSCDVRLSTYKMIQQHVEIKKHRKSAAKSIMLTDNSVTLQDGALGNYHCFSCDLHFKNAMKHINDPSHRIQMSKTQEENFVIRSKSEGSRKYYCLFCDCHFDVFLDHMKDSTHQIKKYMPDEVSLVTENSIRSKTAFYLCTLCNVRLFTRDMVKKHVEEKQHLLKLGGKYQEHNVLADNFIVKQRSGEQNYYCRPCRSYLSDVLNHIEHPRHNNQMLRLLANDFIVWHKSQKYYCFFCDILFDSVSDHLRTSDHQTNRESPEKNLLISENCVSSRSSSYLCMYCNEHLTTFRMVKEHTTEKKHVFRLEHSFFHHPQTASMMSENLVVMTYSSESPYYCFFCDCYCMEFFDHLKEPLHTNNQQIPEKKVLMSKDNGIVHKTEWLYCIWCKEKLYTFKLLKDHLKRIEHKCKKRPH
ncbi:hypothetical protein QAD02_024153 [Eretmocerus hayati]|uniref:Uncharacterized protein n=1 Tax=Eretmocerus hayati TaxID=131215 RepID=A0ACC2PXY3_9HYME|nr:hypothetical protein QAD02_024153 [Eretmocerus hayati]